VIKKMAIKAAVRLVKKYIIKPIKPRLHIMTKDQYIKSLADSGILGG